MYLLIDPSQKELVRLVLFSAEGQTDEHAVPARNRELLKVLDQFLQNKRMKPSDITGIAVVVGAGSFTDTRIAAVLANTFGYVLKIPLLSVSLERSADFSALAGRLQKQSAGQYITAAYSGEPNIGRK